VRAEATELCKKQLELAEYIGAGCCVNIAGGHGTVWDGPHPDSFSSETFGEVVCSVREIIDAVKPARTKYSLEMMPYMIPDSPESFIKLLKAVDRPGFGVHVDIVNIINSPYRYYANKAVIDECFDLLGDEVISCHAKDIWLENQLTVHLNERVPGDGFLDYRTYIERVNRLGGDVAFMLEHLHSREDLDRGLAFVRKTAAELGIEL
jgi:sugar phosphate isomerase/epimerase